MSRSNNQRQGADSQPTSISTSTSTSSSNLSPSQNVTLPDKIHLRKEEESISQNASPASPYPSTLGAAQEIQPQAPISDSEQDSKKSRLNPLNYFRRCKKDSSCEACNADRISSFADIREAFVITWYEQRKHLFTAWVHVPLGVFLLLFTVWVIKLGVDRAPFRFPSPVFAMIFFFFSLLILDWLSIKYPGKVKEVSSSDVEKRAEESSEEREKREKKERNRKRFADPVLAVIAPPMNFLLRNMSVLFTPSFILIPAREVIPGKEIGILTAWFAITQVLAFVFPVLLHWFYDWLFSIKSRRQARMEQEKDDEALNRSRSRKGSVVTLSGLEYEKGVSYTLPGSDSINRLGPIATGLSGVTAIVTAPVSHVAVVRDDDVTHLEGVGLEQARQQGEPDVRTPNLVESFPGSPRSEVSSFMHQNPHGPGRGHTHRSSARRAASRERSSSRERPTSRGRDSQRVVSDSTTTNASSYVGSPLSEEYRFPGPSPTLQPISSRIAFQPVLETAAGIRAAEAATARNSLEVEEVNGTEDGLKTAVGSRRGSLVPPALGDIQNGRRESKSSSVGTMVAGRNSESTEHQKPTSIVILVDEDKQKPSRTDSAASDEKDEKEKDVNEDEDARRLSMIRSRRGSVASMACSTHTEADGPDAIERLSSWISDLITPFIFFCLFIVGIPLWFVYEFALPLFLAVNLLTFVAAITIVPPQVRRFLHPILSCSIATVLILWAFGAMAGKSLKDTLAFYDRDATYKQLWNINGYNGPVPGAGDLLFSALDAGIVALALPMYRYRIDLRDNFFRMLITLVPCAALSLFVWPTIGHLMGLVPSRSLAFSARFMSTPLAIEYANIMMADESITVILVVITGILAAILYRPFFRMMRISLDDHLAIGITMGSTAGAIGASSLISKPRVMAVASLAFVIFGAILLICAAIPPIVEIVQSLSGM